MNLPEKIEGNKRWVVVFDEFQEINKLNGESFEKQLRAAIQFHKNVSYVFMGSKTHMLLNIFGDKSRAFYNIGKTVKVEKIQVSETIKFLKNRFADFNIELTKESAGYIIEVSENIPYYVQFLSAEIWQSKIGIEHSDNEKIKVKRQDIDDVVNRVIEAQSDYYIELYTNLSAYQKRVLFAISKSGSNIFSKEYSENYSLSTVSSTQRAVQKLIDLAIIKKNGEESLLSKMILT